MYNRTIYFLIISTFLFASMNARSCRVPDKGYDWTINELIEKSGSIVIAKLSKKEEKGSAYVYTLEVLSVLKGPEINSISFQGFGYNEALSNDFDNHIDNRFWKENVGRSDFPCCLCGPNHIFRNGEKYLVFPDAFGSMKSAEVIKNDDDRWLQYVRDRL